MVCMSSTMVLESIYEHTYIAFCDILFYSRDWLPTVLKSGIEYCPIQIDFICSTKINKINQMHQKSANSKNNIIVK